MDRCWFTRDKEIILEYPIKLIVGVYGGWALVQHV